MNSAWDKALPDIAIWREALRASKPGAHMIVFGGTRVEHRLGVQLEDAGWEIRDLWRLFQSTAAGIRRQEDKSCFVLQASLVPQNAKLCCSNLPEQTATRCAVISMPHEAWTFHTAMISVNDYG